MSLHAFHEAAINSNLWRTYPMPTKKNETNSKLASSLSLLHAVLFLELVYASAGVNQLLLAKQATRNQMRVMLNNMYK